MYFLGNLTELLARDDAAMFPDIVIFFFGESNIKENSRKEVQTVLLGKLKKNIFKKEIRYVFCFFIILDCHQNKRE